MGRHFLIFFALLLFSQSASPMTGGLSETIPEAQQALLRRAIRERRSVTPEVARKAVGRFAGIPETEVRLSAFYDRPVYRYAFEKTGFTFEVNREEGWRFEVRAGNGRIVEAWWNLVDPKVEENTPAIPRARADAIADAYAREHIPRFQERRWHHEVLRVNSARAYLWWELLGPLEVRAPMEYEVDVDLYTERVRMYREPTLPSLPPLQPQVSFAEARRLALEAAPFDPKKLPLDPPHLEAGVNLDGSRTLEWKILQPFPMEPVEGEEEPYPEYRTITVDALSGYVYLDAPLGLPLGWMDAARQPKVSKPDLTWVSVRHPKQNPTEAPSAGKIRYGRLWIKAESLRLFGAKVNADPRALWMRHEKVALSGRSVDAEFRSRGDYAWWVPLRKVVSRFGWQLTWDPKKREVLLHGPPLPQLEP